MYEKASLGSGDGEEVGEIRKLLELDEALNVLHIHLWNAGLSSDSENLGECAANIGIKSNRIQENVHKPHTEVGVLEGGDLFLAHIHRCISSSWIFSLILLLVLLVKPVLIRHSAILLRTFIIFRFRIRSVMIDIKIRVLVLLVPLSSELFDLD